MIYCQYPYILKISVLLNHLAKIPKSIVKIEEKNPELNPTIIQYFTMFQQNESQHCFKNLSRLQGSFKNISILYISVFAIHSSCFKINDTLKMYFDLYEGWHAINTWPIDKN